MIQHNTKYPFALFTNAEIENGWADKVMETHKRLYKFCESHNILFNPPRGKIIYLENVSILDFQSLMEQNFYIKTHYKWSKDGTALVIPN